MLSLAFKVEDALSTPEDRMLMFLRTVQDLGRHATWYEIKNWGMDDSLWDAWQHLPKLVVINNNRLQLTALGMVYLDS